jgi:CDP-diglyceride synthetase
MNTMSKEDKSRIVYGVAMLVLGIVSLFFIPMWHIFVGAIWVGLIIELMWRNLTCGRIQALPLSLILGVNGWFGCDTMYHLRTADHGVAKIIIFAVMTIMSDTMAWFAGKHLKWWGEWGDKHPFPNASEKKTNRGHLLAVPRVLLVGGVADFGQFALLVGLDRSPALL